MSPAVRLAFLGGPGPADSAVLEAETRELIEGLVRAGFLHPAARQDALAVTQAAVQMLEAYAVARGRRAFCGACGWAL